MFRWIVLLVVWLAACSATAATAPSVFVGFGEPRAAYRFDADETGWDIFTSPDEQALFWVNRGVLEGAVVPDRGYIWSLNDHFYNDISIQAVVQQTRGMEGNGFGLLCRADETGNGYYFVISSAGQFAILKGDLDAGIDPVPLVNWQPSPLIQRGFASNTLQAVCLGDYLSFFINGQFVAEVHDKTLSGGRLGVVLGAVGETAWVSFDDIVVRQVTALR